VSQRLFIIGASGYVGGTLARHFVAENYSVTGLVRSADAADRLRQSGIRPEFGDLESDIVNVLAIAKASDAVVYAAQVDFSREPLVVEALCQALAGTGKTLIFLSGSGVLMQRTEGAWSPDSYSEDDEFTAEPLAIPRVEAERIVRTAAQKGVRAIVIRPPIIWGPGDNGPVAGAYRSIAKTGAACYVGSGLAVYGNVHSADLADLFVLVLKRGRAGALYHAVAGEIPYRWIAEAVARDMGVPTRSVTMEEAIDIFGPFGALLQSSCSRIRDSLTREELDWVPKQHDMLSTVGEPRLRVLADVPLKLENRT